MMKESVGKKGEQETEKQGIAFSNFKQKVQPFHFHLKRSNILLDCFTETHNWFYFIIPFLLAIVLD